MNREPYNSELRLLRTIPPRNSDQLRNTRVLNDLGTEHNSFKPFRSYSFVVNIICLTFYAFYQWELFFSLRKGSSPKSFKAPNLNYRRKHCIQIFSSKTINFRNNYKSLKVTIYLPGQYLQQLPSLRIGLLHDNGGQNRTVHDTMFFCTGKKIDMIQIRD